jgi:hypothetical protein
MPLFNLRFEEKTRTRKKSWKKFLIFSNFHFWCRVKQATVEFFLLLYFRFKAPLPHVITSSSGVARWFLFKPQNPNLGKFWRLLDWKILMYFMAIWNILQTFWIFYRHFGYFITIWYILCSSGTFFTALVSCTKKNLATLILILECVWQRQKAILKGGLSQESSVGIHQGLSTLTLLPASPLWKRVHVQGCQIYYGRIYQSEKTA